jgi:hypothetical protein
MVALIFGKFLIKTIILATYSFGAPPDMIYSICDGSGEICPEKENLKVTDFLGVTDADGSGFSRNLDTQGLCDRFAGVDLICNELKKIGKWKTQSNCSALDFQLWLYNKEHKNIGDGNLQDFLSKDSKKITKYINSDLLDYAQNFGVCSEENFRSEFPNNIFPIEKYINKNFSYDKKELSSFRNKNIARSVQTDFIKSKTEATHSLPEVCASCATFAPTLSNKDWEDIATILKSSKDTDSEFTAFNEINKKSCPAEKRVKLPADYTIQNLAEGKDQRKFVNETLNKLGIIKIGIGAKTLNPSFGVANQNVTDHAAIIAYASCDQSPDQKIGYLNCYYGIKNSWHLDCRTVKDTKDRLCDKKSGAVLLSWSGLFNGLDEGSGASEYTVLVRKNTK